MQQMSEAAILARREYDRQYREAHREQLREKRRQYIEANREQINAKRREWAAAHPEKLAEYKARHWEKKAMEISKEREQ